MEPIRQLLLHIVIVHDLLPSFLCDPSIGIVLCAGHEGDPGARLLVGIQSIRVGGDSVAGRGGTGEY